MTDKATKKAEGKVKQWAKATFKDEKVSVFVFKDPDGTWRIELELPGSELTFDTMALCSKQFKTRKINTQYYSDGGGCPTCGHGEHRTITLHIKEATI